MTALFGRVAELSVGQSNADGTKWTGLRTVFEIEKTCESTPNPGKVSIYNLSESSRGKLQLTKNLVMMLKVGYAGLGDTEPLLEVIYSGDVKRVNFKREGPDIITILEAGDAERAIREKHVDMSFSPFTPVATVIKTVKAKLGLAEGKDVPATGVFEHGFSFSGLVSECMDALTNKSGLEWHVTDGEVNVVPPTLPTSAKAVKLTKDTGLIGIPSKTDKGIECVCLLNPKIKPGTAIDLESEAITGVFRTRTVRFRGDTHGREWIARIEAV